MYNIFYWSEDREEWTFFTKASIGTLTCFERTYPHVIFEAIGW